MEPYYEGHKIFLDEGYPAIYLPKHPHSKISGAVRIHILQAEKILGRYLNPGEVVHHKDENKLNYSFDNLMCFQTNNDHISFHHGNQAFQTPEGVYFCVKKSYACAVCGCDVTRGYNICRPCYLKRVESERTFPFPSKDQLLDDIKKYSFLSIGKKYGVSDNAVRKWCKKYGLPHRRAEINKIKQ